MPEINRQYHTLGRRVFYSARKSALLRRLVAMPVFVGTANRIARRMLQPAAGYPQWIHQRLKLRRDQYRCEGEPGLLSFLTTVWDMPVDLLRPAVASLLKHQTISEFQWVILDNGSRDADVIDYLKGVAAADARVVLLRAEKNLGIIGGMQLAMSHATGRYLLPFDSDDLLYPDAVAILTHQLAAYGYPPLMYSDEDKLDGDRQCWPYFKPDWDPVLFLNSCYIAHLTCIDRRLAIELDVFTDQGCDGCHDWDAFTRFMLAGHLPVHIPEMLYSWRMHGNSTASNTRSKSYILDSQRHLLCRYLSGQLLQEKFTVRLSPLFQQTPDWWVERKPGDARAISRLVLHDDRAGISTAGKSAWHISARSEVKEILPLLTGRADLVCICFDQVQLDSNAWEAEITGLLELHPDTVMVGARVINSAGRITEAGRVPGFGGVFGCPDRDRDSADPGNGAELWKRRSVGGVSTHLCVMRVDFLQEVLQQFSHRPISWYFLGAWAALLAWRTHRRIVYTPFFSGVSNFDPDRNVAAEETHCFIQEAQEFLPDTRFYSRHFSLLQNQGYLPVAEPTKD